MTGNGLIAAVVILGLAALFWSLPSPPSLDGMNPITRTSPKFVAWRGPDDATAIIKAEDRSTHAVLATAYRGPDGVLRDDPERPGTAVFVETRILAFGTTEHQIGTVAGYFNRNGGNTDRFQVGVHYEPCTVFYGTISLPSVAVTKDIAGLGVVFHLPPEGFPKLSALGLGVWEAAPFDGGRPGLFVGASCHITLP